MQAEYDLAPISKPVRIGKENFIVVEAYAAAAAAWKNSILQHVKVGADGRPTGIGAVADSELILVAMCTCEAEADCTTPKRKGEEYVTVPIAKVRRWPAKLVKDVFDWVQEHSSLTSEAETVQSLEVDAARIASKLEVLRSQANPTTAG